MRGAGAGFTGGAGSIAGGDGADVVGCASGTCATAGAAAASRTISAGAWATATGAAGEAAGTDSDVCARFTPAQPAARQQESTSAMLTPLHIAARSIIGPSWSEAKDLTCTSEMIAPRSSVTNPGRAHKAASLRRESVRFSFHENHESLALLCHAESCFSASSLAMPYRSWILPDSWSRRPAIRRGHRRSVCPTALWPCRSLASNCPEYDPNS